MVTRDSFIQKWPNSAVARDQNRLAISCQVEPRAEELPRVNFLRRHRRVLRVSSKSKPFSACPQVRREEKRGNSLSSGCAEWQVSGEFHKGSGQ